MKKESQFAYKKPAYNPPSIENIIKIEAKGPWKTKSDADLIVLFAMSQNFLLEFLKYDKDELRYLSQNIKGLRIYSVKGLRKGSKGGEEFHRVRNELIFGLNGVFDIECEDVYRNKKSLILDFQRGIYIPPFLLHTYKTIEDGELLVLANTLFNPEDSKTHDTYSKETFRKLQRKYK